MKTNKIDTSGMIVPAQEVSPSVASYSSPLATVHAPTQSLLVRMFADPNVLEKPERAALVRQLRACVAQNPHVSELRVLLGMAMCVNLDAQAAIEELREAVRLAPDSFIAHLKMGELWMRLRVCRKAEEHTQRAAALAQNLAQSEMARRQATTIRTMLREGIERGGLTRAPWLSFSWLRRIWSKHRTEDLAAVEMN